MVQNSNQDINYFAPQFDEIENYIKQRDKINPKVSKVDVAWHLDHSLKTINSIYKALENSNPNQFKPNFSLSRFFIYAWGDFPRGFAKAPRYVLPPDNVTLKSLQAQLEEAKENLKKLENLDARTHFKHPYFNFINKKQSKRFIKIHTRHHLRIVRDILKE